MEAAGDDLLELVVVAGAGRGAAFRLEPGSSRIGRGEDVAVRITDPRASRYHAEIALGARGASIRDLDSKNGTLLNGEPLDRAPLAVGDEVRIGDTVLLVCEPEAEGAGSLGGAGRSTLRADREGLKVGPGQALIGGSQAMREVHRLVLQVARSDIPVLVTGESGTGKELVAQAIHRHGARRDGPFVVTNSACLDGPLADSELFGHERGAFTGAAERRVGRIEEAAGGTLFLDEVGELPASTQAKLLRVVEGKPFSRLGGAEPITPRVRLVAATHRDLQAMIAEGAFREDLFYRLRVVTIALPPLRERRDDLEALVDHFLAEVRKRPDPPRLERFDPEALAALRAYDFPGNVRELRHAVERAAVLCPVEEATLEHLPPEIVEAARGAAPGDETDGGFRTLKDLERLQLEKALREAEGNKSQAARLLGIHRATLYKMLERHGIDT